MKREFIWYFGAGMTSSILLDFGKRWFAFIPQQAPRVMFWVSIGILALGGLMLGIWEVKEFIKKIKG